MPNEEDMISKIPFQANSRIRWCITLKILFHRRLESKGRCVKFCLVIVLTHMVLFVTTLFLVNDLFGFHIEVNQTVSFTVPGFVHTA